jgi:hypothetical protein
LRPSPGAERGRRRHDGTRVRQRARGHAPRPSARPEQRVHAVAVEERMDDLIMIFAVIHIADLE